MALFFCKILSTVLLGANLKQGIVVGYRPILFEKLFLDKI